MFINWFMAEVELNPILSRLVSFLCHFANSRKRIAKKIHDQKYKETLAYLDDLNWRWACWAWMDPLLLQVTPVKNADAFAHRNPRKHNQSTVENAKTSSTKSWTIRTKAPMQFLPTHIIFNIIITISSSSLTRRRRRRRRRRRPTSKIIITAIIERRRLRISTCITKSSRLKRASNRRANTWRNWSIRCSKLEKAPNKMPRSFRCVLFTPL